MPTATISEYSASINTPQMIKATVLQGGYPLKKNGRIIKYSGGFCVVFPYVTPQKKYAVRCWHINIDGIRHRTKLISETIQKFNLPYFVGFEYVNDGIQTAHGAQDIVVMDWVNAQPLKKYISEHLYDSRNIEELANSFKEMVTELHTYNIAHGDLQHGNILVRDDGKIILVDYDSMYVPSLSGFPDNIKGLAGYQHPSRWKNTTLSEKIDFFSELIIYTSLIALSKIPRLWTEFNLEDTETLLFSAEDISSKGSSRIFQILDDYDELKPLSSKIKEYLDIDNIDLLEPLEKVIVDSKKEMLSTLSEEWKDNGYVKTTLTKSDLQIIAKIISKNW